MSKTVITFYELSPKMCIDNAQYFKFQIDYCKSHPKIPALFDAVKDSSVTHDKFTQQYSPISFRFPSIDKEITILHTCIKNEKDALDIEKRIKRHFPDADHLAIINLGSFFYDMVLKHGYYSEYDKVSRTDEYYDLPEELIPEYDRQGIKIMFVSWGVPYSREDRTFKRAQAENALVDDYLSCGASKYYDRLDELKDKTLRSFFDYLFRSIYENRQYFGNVLFFACPGIYESTFGASDKSAGSKGQYCKREKAGIKD